MKRALLIGIDYLSIPTITLNGCVYDIINMSRLLVDAYDYDSITVLRDDLNNPSTMPTRENIINNIKNIVNQSTSLDEIWIHYSGHGSQIPDKDSFTSNGLNNILVPCDYQKAGFITDKDLFAIIKNIKCKALLLFDACHSGTMCDLEWCFQYSSPTAWSKSQNKKVVINNPNVYVISACKDDQTSVDTYVKVNKTAEGAFTCALISGLRYYRHNVSINQLYQYICSYLKTNNFVQVPILSASTQNPNYVFTRSFATIPVPAVATLASSTAVVAKTMKSIMTTN